MTLVASLMAACDSPSSAPLDGGGDASAGVDGGGTQPDGTPPDAAPEPCGTPGATRTVPCGNCGTQSELCEGGVWAPQSACLAQGDCSPNAVETEPLPYCGEQQRLCDGECHWTEWTETVPGTGPCNQGETRVDHADCGELWRQQVCSDTCTWENQGECADECGGTPRTSPWYVEEICIPAGPFIRGSTVDTDASPVTEVYVSAYYIDRYPVTHRRYRECMEAGLCVPPASEYARGSLLDAALDDFPIRPVQWQEAVAFCEADGGRRLLTEAEWEKAARGPAPRENLYTWDDPGYRCDLFWVTSACGPGEIPYVEPVTGLPGVRTYYGVDAMMGAGRQWVSDWYEADYYGQADSLIDPQGPATATYRAARGEDRHMAGAQTHITDRFWGTGTVIRCGR